MQLKKYYPFIVPTIALLLVLFLAFRWYNLRTQRDADLDRTSVEIENLTADEIEIVRGTEDVSTVNLEAEDDEQLAIGHVRYKIQGDKVLLNVSAELQQLESGVYQVWLKTETASQAQKAFILAYGKGGYMGSAALTIEELPLEIIVSREINTIDDEIEVKLLRGLLEAEIE